MDDEEHTVAAGASATFEGKAAHEYRNDGPDPDPVEMTMSVMIPPGR
ncbi:hypothetical protein [Streptomyces sp. NPDC101150]